MQRRVVVSSCLGFVLLVRCLLLNRTVPWESHAWSISLTSTKFPMLFPLSILSAFTLMNLEEWALLVVVFYLLIFVIRWTFLVGVFLLNKPLDSFLFDNRVIVHLTANNERWEVQWLSYLYTSLFCDFIPCFYLQRVLFWVLLSYEVSLIIWLFYLIIICGVLFLFNDSHGLLLLACKSNERFPLSPERVLIAASNRRSNLLSCSAVLL